MKCERGEQVGGGGCEEGEFKCLGGRCIPMHQVLLVRISPENQMLSHKDRY